MRYTRACHWCIPRRGWVPTLTPVGHLMSLVPGQTSHCSPPLSVCVCWGRSLSIAGHDFWFPSGQVWLEGCRGEQHQMPSKSPSLPHLPGYLPSHSSSVRQWRWSAETHTSVFYGSHVEGHWVETWHPCGLGWPWLQDAHTACNTLQSGTLGRSSQPYVYPLFLI